MNKRGIIGIIIIVGIILASVGAWFIWDSFTDKVDEIKNGNENNDELLVGGCAGVSLENLQVCCDNWEIENNLTRVTCTGNWTIENNICSWNCN